MFGWNDHNHFIVNDEYSGELSIIVIGIAERFTLLRLFRQIFFRLTYTTKKQSMEFYQVDKLFLLQEHNIYFIVRVQVLKALDPISKDVRFDHHSAVHVEKVIGKL